MRSKFKWIFTLLVAFSMQFSFAQEKTITGTVTEGGMPLPGVNVVVKGTTRSAQTDFDGKYSLKAKTGEVLEFSFIGMKSKLITVGASSAINVVMEEDAMVLDAVEVVNTGYDRTSTKATTSSAVTTISAKTIENRPNASFLSSLQGTTPGLTILNSSGSPGSSKIDMFIRGISSINAATEPLIVIDGVPTNGTQFRNLNQNDIETINILRDAAATSIYGNRGANGVIVITTKKAKYGSSLKITYDGTTGISTLPSNNYNMASAKEVLLIENRKGTGLGSEKTLEEIMSWDGANTDWSDVFFNQDVTQQHNLGLQFGGQNVANYTSFGYYKQGGLVPTTDFQRITLRNNFSGKTENNKFTYSSQLALGYSVRNQLNQENNSGVDNNSIQNPLLGALGGLPYVTPGQFENGYDLIAAIGTDFSGPNDTYVLEDILKGSMPNRYTETSILANLMASYKFTDDFSFTNKIGVDYKVIDRAFARAPWNYLALAVAQGAGEEYGGLEVLSNTRDFTFTNIASFNYSKTFNEVHRFDAGVFMEYQKAHYMVSSRQQNGLNPLSWSLGTGTGYIPFAGGNSYVPAVGATKLDVGTLSYFATADYTYKEKYGFSGVVRRDASYRFIEDNRWGTFWSVAGRWNIDQEDFMKDSMFDMLKLRASYGTQGNQNVLAVAYGMNPLLSAINNVRDLYSSTTAYDAQGVGFNNSQIANDKLQWEEISQLNIGLDFKLLKSRLEGNIDVYQKDTDNLYTTIRRSAATGMYGQDGNNGKLRNSGVELMLKYNLFNTDNFKMTVFANGSYNKNEVLAIDIDDQSGDDATFYPGHMVYEWNLIPYVGVNQSNGNLLFLDKDGNVTETPDVANDRRLQGNSVLPEYQGGFGFNADYKGFFADVLFSWSKGAKKLDIANFWAYQIDFIGDDNVSADFLNAWTAENPTDFPALTASNQQYSMDSTRFLQDASFVRLRSATIGYNFPKRLLERSFISDLKVFMQGENLALWTKWRGWDPEQFTLGNPSSYPNPRTISFGVSVQF